MNSIFRQALVIGVVVMGLYSPKLWAKPADFAGVWETSYGWADEFFGMGAIQFTNCAIAADINTQDDLFTIKSIVVKCANSEKERFVQVTPRVDFKLGANGDLSNDYARGKITGNLLQFQIEDAYDGVHYFKLEAKGDILYFGWSYEGEMASTFEISGGAKGLVRTVGP